jgi:hypothetical protein
MDRDRRRRAGLAGILGGAGLLASVLLEAPWLPTVGGMAQLDPSAGVPFRFVEVLPMALLTVGLLGFAAFEGAPQPDIAGLGSAVAAAGGTVATVGHATEHVLLHAGSSLGPVFVWSHYLGFGLVGLGLTVAGIGAERSPAVGARERALLVSTLPAAVVVALVLGTLWPVAYADGYEVYVAIVVALVSYRLRRPVAGIDAAADAAVSKVPR